MSGKPRPFVIAHRGSSWDEPENTLPAFQRAIAHGADFVEFDVHATAEGELVVVHDRPAAGAPVPTLEDVLSETVGRVGIMAELKEPYRYRRHDVVRRVVQLLPADAFVLSFEPAALRQVALLEPGLRTVQHLHAGVSIVRASAYSWGVGFAARTVTTRALARARWLGLETLVYTVNDVARMRELADLAVTGIVTDRPDVLRRALDER